MTETSHIPESQGLTGIDGQRISNRDIQRSLRLSMVAGCFGTLWISLSFGMPLTMFMDAIGASGVLIGLITTVRLACMAAQIPGAILSEHFSSRKMVFGPLATASRALWFVPAFLALIWYPSYWWMPTAVIMTIALSDLLGNASGAPWISWMTDLIPSKTSGRFWGTRQSIVTAVSLLGLWLAGFMLDLFRDPHSGKTGTVGFAIVFGLAAVAGVTDIALHWWIHEPRPGKADHTTTQLARMGTYRSEIAVPDLIEKLDDPSMDLQEESIEALGAIATLAAVDIQAGTKQDSGNNASPEASARTENT